MSIKGKCILSSPHIINQKNACLIQYKPVKGEHPIWMYYLVSHMHE